MMKKTLAICLGLALILTLCGTFAGALASEVENGIDAIEDAMMKGNTNTSSFFDGMDDLREGTSADTVPTPDDFPSKYNYGSGKIQDYSRDNMLRRWAANRCSCPGTDKRRPPSAPPRPWAERPCARESP